MIDFPTENEILKIKEYWDSSLKSDPTSHVIILPPPNVSGNLHMGHALNASIIDSFIRAYKISGEGAYILPGLDHGGISTEFSAKKEGYIDNKTLKKEKFAKIEQFANSCKDNIIGQIKKMGLLVKWDAIRYTFDDTHRKLVNDKFIDFYNKGFIYRKKSIVNWDTNIKTAVSDLEIEYRDDLDFFFKIPYETSIGGELHIWTTRPETIFADSALAVNPEDDRYKKYIGKYAYVPILKRKIPIIADSNVDKVFGSGVLKITPAHDPLDYKIGIEHNLKFYNIMDENGKLDFTELNSEEQKILKEYAGLSCKEAKKIVGDKICIEKTEKKRRIPYSSKSETVLEYRYVKQWFFQISIGAKLALKILNKDWNIFPQSWRGMFFKWLESTEDWCISRNITWGHSLPAWYKGDQVFVGDSPPDNNWEKTDEVLDTWFSSALWPLAYDEYPTTVLVTAYDIIFFWVAKMIMTLSILELPSGKFPIPENFYLQKGLPFDNVFIHKLVRDKNGQKMSKSKGNVVDPIKIIEKKNCSVDALRVSLISRVNPAGNINYSEELIEDANALLNKILNFARYIERNKEETGEGDKDIENYYNEILVRFLIIYKNALKKFEIHIMYQESVKLLYEVCDWLLEFHKLRKGLWEVLIRAYKIILRSFHPFAPFLTTHIWNVLFESSIYEIFDEDFVFEDKKNKTKELKEAIIFSRKIKSIPGANIVILPGPYSDLISFLGRASQEGRTDFFKVTYRGFDFSISLSVNTSIKKEILGLENKIEKLEQFFLLDLTKIKESIIEQKKKEKEFLKEELLILEEIKKNYDEVEE